MPTPGAWVAGNETVTVTVRDLGGEVATVSVEGGTTVLDAAASAFANAVGNASNARAEAYNQTNPAYADENAIPFDEAYASVSTKAVLVFQNPSRDVRKIMLPAPDASLFAADGFTIDPAQTQAAALITATLAILPAGYEYVRGFKSTKTRKTGKVRSAVTPAEPGAGDLPADAPATGGV